METLEAAMTPASHPEAMTEVNNNETLAQKQRVKETEAAGPVSPSPSDPETPVQSQETQRTVTVTDPEEWLCVAKLPPSTDHDTFLDLLSEFGGVKESFLLVSSKTGSFKGYGFACFHSKVAALQARHVLDGQEVDGHLVECGWLKEGSHNLSDLHSKVLYVDKLPVGFRDLAQFRKLFSRIVNPPYCQIAQKHGVLQDWGLVEYNTAEEAEATMETLRGAKLDDEEIRVQYCIPNIHAINIYMNFVNNPMERVEKKALMDETPSKDVYHQLQSLSKQNPWFVQSLQSIMTQSTLAEDGAQPPSQPPSDQGTPEAGSGSNQAILALLLAAYLKPGGQGGGVAQLAQLIKQLESGTPALDLLKAALSPAQGLLPSPSPSPGSDLASLISSMTSLVGQGQLPSAPPATSSVTPSTKNPQLMNMLYSAFQARMSKLQTTDKPESPTPSQVSPSLGDAVKPPTPTPVSAPGPAPQEAGVPGTPVYSCTVPQYMYPAPGHYPQYPGPGHEALLPAPPVSSHSNVKAMPQFLSLPPPPPPPGAGPAYDPQWQFVAPVPPGHGPAPGPGLLYSPVMTPGLWAQPPPQHHGLYGLPPQQKRKMEDYCSLQPQVTAYPEVDNQTVKRQKLCGGGN